MSFTTTCLRDEIAYEGETTSVGFDSAGRVDRKNLPNGMYETYQFDVRSRPEYIRTYNSGGTLQDTKSYSWDMASRITDAVEGGVATSYGYDDIDQHHRQVGTTNPS